MKKLKNSVLLLFLALGLVATPRALFAADSDSDDWILGDSDDDSSGGEGASGEKAPSLLALALGEKLEECGYLAILSERFGGHSEAALRTVAQRMVEWWQNAFPQDDPNNFDWSNFVGEQSDDTFGAGEAFRRELLRIERRVLPEGTYVRLAGDAAADGRTVLRPVQVVHVGGAETAAGNGTLATTGAARTRGVPLLGGTGCGAAAGGGTLSTTGGSGTFDLRELPPDFRLVVNQNGIPIYAFLPPEGNGVTPLDASFFRKQLVVDGGVSLTAELRRLGFDVDTIPDAQCASQLQGGQAPPLLGAGVPATTRTRAITSGSGGSGAGIPMPRITINGEDGSNGQSATRGLNLGGESEATESPLRRHRRRSRRRTLEGRAAALDARNRNANLKMREHREAEGTGFEGNEEQVDRGDRSPRSRSGSGDSSSGGRSRFGSGLGNPTTASASAAGGGGGGPGGLGGIENPYNRSRDAAFVLAAIGVVVIACMAAKKYGPGAKTAIKRFCARNDLGRFVTKAWWLSKGKGLTSFSQRKLSSFKGLLPSRFPWTSAAV